MDQNQTQTNQEFSRQSEQEMLQEILKYTRRTYNYMRWQMYIMIILVVLPLLAMAFILPQVLKGLSGAYIQGLQ